MNKKIIILHDTFLYKGWWERLILMMGKILKADIASGFFSSGSFDLRYEWFTGKMISVSSEIFKKWFRHLKLKWAFFFKTKFLQEYDIALFSGDCITAQRNCWKNTKKIYYCHTPPRYIYDLHELYLKKVPFLAKPLFKLFCFLFKYFYEKDINAMNLVLTNSENTKKRIERFLWVSPIVLYPPVDTKKFIWLWQKDYYLSFARLADAKRVDKIVQAFTQMPEKKLIVIYGENDPAREKIFTMGQWYTNIEFITLKNNIWFEEYIGNCIATIYIPIDEDFWMSPLESMSTGKPVLWVDDGWLKETIIHEKTGLLIAPDAKVEDIKNWVVSLSKERCLEMRADCEKRAKEFWLEEFEEKLKELVNI